MLFRDLTGYRYGRLLILKKAPNKGVKTAWHVLCDCGRQLIVKGNLMQTGRTKSCGCLRKDTSGVAPKHGMVGSRTYNSWMCMRRRCYDQKCHNYPKYGAVGINVCERWKSSFENFFLGMGERPIGKTLDRINPFGNYEPSNCRWATPKEQSNNRRVHHDL